MTNIKNINSPKSAVGNPANDDPNDLSEEQRDIKLDNQLVVTIGPRHIKEHVTLSKEYRKNYKKRISDTANVPDVVNGITYNGSCSDCGTVSDSVKYSTTYKLSICDKCKHDDEQLIELTDVEHNMTDMTEWIPIIRDFEHNLILQHKRTNAVGLSSSGTDGTLTYISIDNDLECVLDDIEKLAIEYSENWTPKTFYDTPIQTYMRKQCTPRVSKCAPKTDETNADESKGTGDKPDESE